MTAIALTIAGSDSAGGAGIQADLKTFAALGVHGASAITALTAQNTLGVEGVPRRAAGLRARADRRPWRAISRSAPSRSACWRRSGVIEAVAEGLERLPGVPVVLDPVMVAASGDVLLDEDAIATLKSVLLPRAIVITPNLPEAAQASRRAASERRGEMRAQAKALRRLGRQAVLIKGGHAKGARSVDLLLDGEGELRLEAPRVPTKNDHGTGCTLSSAIAAELAKGASLREAVAAAKAYVTAAIARGRRASRSARAGAPCTISTRGGRGSDGLALGHHLHPLLAEARDAQPQLIARL